MAVVGILVKKKNRKETAIYKRKNNKKYKEHGIDKIENT